MTAAPLCQVCGKPEVMGLMEQEHWLLCFQCWTLGLGYADERKKRTCSVCGKFPLTGLDHYTSVRSQPDADGWTVDFLCREHFQDDEGDVDDGR
jgi:hypothetical protein